MPTSSDFLSPLGTTGAQGTMRNALVKRVIYVIGPTENPTDFVALDAGTGAQPLAIGYNNLVFWLDATDTTTAHDGVTCIVTSDGYRYKISGVDGRIRSVLSNVVTAPPGSPTLGDAYLIPAGATGAWSSHVDSIAIWTARGWSYVAPKIGLLIYVQSALGYYHYPPSGTWTAGIGTSALGAGTVLPASLLGGKSKWEVENQTTNTPPGSPADGVQYIIGPSPTGAWAGSAGKLAIALNSAWIIVPPLEGYQAYDRNLNTGYVYNSGWIAQVSGYDQISMAENTASTALNNSGSSGGYVYSATSAPTSTQARRNAETLTASLQANYAGQVFDIEYRAMNTAIGAPGTGTNSQIVLGIFVDSEVNARDWVMVSLAGVAVGPILCTFSLALSDTSSHILSLIFFVSGTSNTSGGTFTVSRRRITVRRRA